MDLMDRIKGLKGLKGYIRDGFHEIHDELGADEPFDFEFFPCKVKEFSDDCHYILINYKGKNVAKVRYELKDLAYELLEPEMIE